MSAQLKVVLLWVVVMGVMGMASISVAAEEIRYLSGERRDPMIALVGPDGLVMKSQGVTGINIEGIIHDPRGESLVLINGVFFRQGESFDGASIVSILKDRVVMIDEDEEKIFWLREEVSNEG